MPETWKVVGGTVALDLKEAGKNLDATSEQDLIELGYTPTKAWVNDDLVVFVHEGKLHDVGL